MLIAKCEYFACLCTTITNNSHRSPLLSTPNLVPSYPLGLDHPNIFLNPSPKKVISAMISLMTDQDRSDLYTIECLRIDTVASLLLNLLSQMSNPVVPYAIMEHYFQQSNMVPVSRSSAVLGSPPPLSSSSRPPLISLGSNSSGGTGTSVSSPPLSSPLSPVDTLGASLPVIPALPVKNGHSPPPSSILAWSREHFDLQMFLDALPAMNRVILLEVLHLCAEVLQHQIFNRLTMSRLVQQVSPALFSTVFDQRMLEQMAGGSRRCSIHGDRISAEEGTRAENHLFSVILVRFLFITTASPYQHEDPNISNNNNDSRRMSEWAEYTRSGLEYGSVPEWDTAATAAEAAASLSTIPYGRNSTQFRKSQELLQHEQQAHYQKMARSFQQMEIQQDPRLQQHFGQYSASQKQKQLQLKHTHNHQQQQQQPKQHNITTLTTTTTNNDHDVNDLVIKEGPVACKPLTTGSSSSSSADGGSGGVDPQSSHKLLVSQPNAQDLIQMHRHHFWSGREAQVGTWVAL